MKINGFDADTEKIGKGLWEIIVDLGLDHIVAMGMIPAELMKKVEEQTRVKIIMEAAKQRNMTVEEFQPFVDGKLVTQTVNPIMQSIAIEIFKAAKEAGKMIV